MIELKLQTVIFQGQLELSVSAIHKQGPKFDPMFFCIITKRLVFFLQQSVTYYLIYNRYAQEKLRRNLLCISVCMKCIDNYLLACNSGTPVNIIPGATIGALIVWV